MQRIVNPKQTRLFEPFDNVLTEKTRKRLLDGWAGVFRHIILELMPVETISGHFDPAMGRPTQELYSMAGLLLIKEAGGSVTDIQGHPWHPWNERVLVSNGYLHQALVELMGDVSQALP